MPSRFECLAYDALFGWTDWLIQWVPFVHHYNQRHHHQSITTNIINIYVIIVITIGKFNSVFPQKNSKFQEWRQSLLWQQELIGATTTTTLGCRNYDCCMNFGQKMPLGSAFGKHFGASFYNVCIWGHVTDNCRNHLCPGTVCDSRDRSQHAFLLWHIEISQTPSIADQPLGNILDDSCKMTNFVGRLWTLLRQPHCPSTCLIM